MRKLKSKIKLFSCIIFPILIIIVSNCIGPIKLLLTSVNTQKLDILMGCIATLIGALIAVLTIYLTFPTNDIIRRRMTDSGHNIILLSNIFTGIILLMSSLIMWLIFDANILSLTAFLCAIANILIASYYIMVLSILSNK